MLQLMKEESGVLLCRLSIQALKSVATRSLVESKLDLGVNEPKVVEVSVNGTPAQGVFDASISRLQILPSLDQTKSCGFFPDTMSARPPLLQIAHHFASWKRQRASPLAHKL